MSTLSAGEFGEEHGRWKEKFEGRLAIEADGGTFSNFGAPLDDDGKLDFESVVDRFCEVLSANILADLKDVIGDRPARANLNDDEESDVVIFTV